MQNHQFQTLDPQGFHQNSNLPRVPNPTVHHKIKPILKQSATWRCLFPSDVSSINKYKPKMLSNITISNLRNERIGPSGFKGLRKALTDLKRASSLIFKDADVDSKQLALLFNSTSHWRKFSFLWSPDVHAKTVSRFGRCKNLEIFPLGENEAIVSGRSIPQNLNLEPFPRIYRQLRELNKVKSLLLNVPFYINAPIKLPRSLHNIHIIFQNNTKQSLSEFISSLENCNRLDHILLNFGPEYQIHVSDVNIWTSFFQHSPSLLKKLTLKIILHCQQQLKQLQYLLESFRYLKQLISLNLSFESYSKLNNVEDNFFSSLFTSIQSLSILQSLSLNFIHFPILQSSNTRQLTKTLQSLENLKILQLSLPSLESPEEDLISISESLLDFTDLKTLDIKLSDTDLSRRLASIFSTNIAHHKLTSFSLNNIQYDLEDSSFTSAIKSSVKKLANIWVNDGLIHFFSNLSEFTQLSALDLRLSAFEISAQEWKQFSLTLTKLQNLSSLKLSLPKINSAKNLENLLSCLQDMPKLASLNLIFQKQISNQEISCLSSHIARCQNLKDLTLNFKELPQLEDQALYSLLPGIQSLLTLESLELMFWKEKPFGVKAATEFVERLTVLKCLSRLLFCGSLYSSPNPPHLPLNIEDYEKMRRLTFFCVNLYDMFEVLEF